MGSRLILWSALVITLVRANITHPWRYLLYLGVLSGFVLLFLGGPGYYSHRVFKAAWDLGHVPFMFVVGMVVLERLLKTQLISKKILPMVYGGVIIGVAFSSEYVQSFVGRTPSLPDVLADLLGGLLAWLFVFGLAQRLLVVLTFIFSIVVITPFSMIMYDELMARQQFPLISGFETRSELSRWTAKSELHRSSLRSTEGLYSLSFTLFDKGYSGVSIKDFPSSWQGYRFLKLDVWSPREQLPITIRIHDKLHTESDQLYSDRFNRLYRLKQGWNRVTITLDDIYSAPQDRAFNLNEVRGLGLFSYNLGAQEMLYLDRLVLVK